MRSCASSRGLSAPTGTPKKIVDFLASVIKKAIADPEHTKKKEGWPEATLSNLLDDDLMPAYTREGGLTPHITERICALALYAARSGADGILFTCSVFPHRARRRQSHPRSDGRRGGGTHCR